MNWKGTIEAIHTAPESGAPMEAREAVEAIAGKGIRGDRHFVEDGTARSGREITLTEAEAIEAIVHEAGIDLGFDEHRRNVTTRGVPLNHLVGEEFRVGDVRCEGIELCEPCSHLESLTEEGVIDALLHRGGLRADIVEEGTIRVGDPVEPL